MSEEKQEQNQQNMSVTQLVDIDDLVWQLGQDVVKEMGYRKLNERVQTQLTQISQQVAESRQEVEKMQEYKQANDRLDVKNKELANALKKERIEKSKVRNERDKLQAEIDRRDKISGKKKKAKVTNG